MWSPGLLAVPPRRVLSLLGAAACLLLAILSSCSNLPLPVAGNGKRGRVDLVPAAESPLPNGNRPIALDGEWQHFRGRLLYPIDFEDGTPGGAVPAPLAREGRAPGERGSRLYGTYHLVIEGTSPDAHEGMIVPALGSAYTIWVNGAKVAESGRVATSGTDEVPGERGTLALFSSTGSRAELVAQISAFHYKGGSGVPILFGSRKAILAYDALSIGTQWSLIALLSLLFLILVGRYLAALGSGRGPRFPLYALVSLAGILGVLTSRSLFGLPMAGPPSAAFPWGIGSRANELSFLAYFPLAYLGVLERAARPAERRYSLVLTIAGSLAAIVPLFLSGGLFPWISVIAGGLLTLGFIYPVATAAGAGRAAASEAAATAAGRRGADPWLAAGLALLLLGSAIDIAGQAGYLQLGSASPAAALLFVLLLLIGDIGGPAGGRAVKLAGGSARLSPGETVAARGATEGEAAGCASLAEELRKPIQGIVSLAESLLAEPALPEGQVLSLSLIASSALRLANAVSDISDEEKLNAGGMDLDLVPVALDQIVERAVEVSRQLVAGRDVKVRNELSRSLPPALGDAGRLERIVYNIVGEAIARLKSGSVVVRGEAGEGTIELRVETHPSEASLQEASTEGSASTSARTRRDTSPLGLHVAEELIRLHRGEVRQVVEGAGDAHFAFAFTLLQAESGVAEEAPGISEELIRLEGLETGEVSAAEAEDDDRSFRILIADDDPVSLQTMRNKLLAEHYRVMTTMNGEQALAMIKAAPPDLVLADAMVTKVNGYDICRAVRRTYAANELPVLILVDPNEMTGLMEGLEAGANDFITKPIVLDEFMVRVKTHLNLAKINSLYSRFVPIELLHFLGHDNVVELKLGDQIQREMTILFVDIRAFTNLSERMTPEENFKFINSYLSRITPIIRQNNGFIDKYIGDAILALYPGNPEDALRSAIRMVEYLHEYNGYRKNSGYRPISVGIGIHTGNLIVGIIGDNERMQGTVISDAVNLASRVQDVTKLYGANIIISQDTFVRLDNPTAYNFRFLGKVKVKGKDQTVSLFEIFDGELPDVVAVKSKTKQAFEDAILLFSQRKLQEAAESFRRIISQNPDDRAAALFLNRANWLLNREKASWLLRG